MTIRTVIRSALLWPGAAVLVNLLVAGLALSFTTSFLPSLHAENGPEPSYNGKPQSYWLDEYDGQNYTRCVMLAGQFLFPLTQEQTNALLHIGTNAVPWLVKRFYNPLYSARGTIQAFRVLGPLGDSCGGRHKTGPASKPWAKQDCAALSGLECLLASQPRAALVSLRLPWAAIFRAFSPRVGKLPTIDVEEPLWFIL